jgi:hypothetical protein
MKITNNDNGLNTKGVSGAGKIRMTAAMKEGLEALQREYEAFRESSFQTLALITDARIARK